MSVDREQFTRELDHIWSTRRLGEQVLARELYENLCAKIALDTNANIDQQFKRLSDQLSQKTALDLLTLKASFQNGQSHYAVAKDILQQLSLLTSNNPSDSASYQYEFEWGLTKAFHVDYHGALCHWRKAATLATTSMELWQCKINIILCCEYLGFDLDDMQRDFAENFCYMQQQPWAAHIKGQYDALCLRNAFARGDLETLQTIKIAASASQAAYQSLFYQELPWNTAKFSKAHRAKVDLTLIENAGKYRAEYRFATLYGGQRQSSASEQRTSDIVQRIYLWSWRWLSRGDTNFLNGALSTLREHQSNLLTKQLSSDEAAYLKNALGWLLLFSGKSITTWHVITSLYHVSNGKCSLLLDYEELLLTYLFTLLQHDDMSANIIKKQLNEHPMAKQNHFGLAQFLDGTCPETLRELSDDYRKLCTPQPSPQDNHIVVNMLSGNASQLLVGFLSNRKEKSVEEVLLDVFGIRSYRPNLHDNKLAKLLVQTNHQYAGSLRVYRRGLLIKLETTSTIETIGYCERWHHLKLSNIALLDLLTSSNAAKDTRRTEHASPTTVAKAPQRPVSRAELQRIWGCSPASVNRKINELLLAKKATRTGTGKGTKYVLSTDSVLNN